MEVAAATAERVTLPDGTEWLCPKRADTLMVWREIFVDGVYAEAADNVPAGGTVVDVGAHTGLAALYFSRVLQRPRILAFEPATDIFRCLSENLCRHVGAAQAYPLAIGSEPGQVSFTYYPDAPSQSGMYADAARDRESTMAYLMNNGTTSEDAEYLCARIHMPMIESVQVVTLSSVLSAADLAVVDLLKIDAERAELEVLKGIAEDDWRRVRSIIMEAHDEGGRLSECVSLLQSQGYTVTVSQVPWLVSSSLFNVAAKR